MADARDRKRGFGTDQKGPSRGNFGVEKGHYEVSVAVSELQLMPAVRAAGPDAIVVADGFSCRTQLDDLAGVRAVHLAQLLLGE